MTNADRDLLLEMLRELPAAAPTVASTERLRARCHAALGQKLRTQSEGRWLWLVAAVSLLYLGAAAAQALRILNLN